jgi:crossover junction endodeoxyribonuclease RuvC
MRVLGVDPGSVVTGWGLLEGTAARPRLIESGVLRVGSATSSFPERLHRLATGFGDLVRQLAPIEAAVEAPFHGVNPRSALQLSHARGVLLATLSGAGVPVIEYMPASVKVAVAGSGKADKAQIRAMVMRWLGLRSLPGPSDRADALAVALCHLACAGHARAVSEPRRTRRRPRP